MAFQPTTEQAAIVEAFQTGDDLVIQAGAGTGKTSTLRLIAQAAGSKRGVYIAYNRAIANEAKASFPSNVKAGTAHSLAFQAVGKHYSHRLNAPRQFARETARLLSLSPRTITTHDGSAKMFSAETLSRVVMGAVAKFCRTADTEITAYHFEVIPGLDAADERGPRRGPVMDSLARELLPVARRAWTDIQSRDGSLRFEHDHYLKMFQLSNPRISGDFLLFDEAQDANPVIAAIVEQQKHMQVILVGDSSQAIYGFTGAVDAMAKFAARGTTVRSLSQSFRFGPAVAEVANRFLDRLDAPLRIVGFDKITSVQATLDAEDGPTADAVLCRTNAGCLGELIAAQQAGRKAALVGGTREQVRFVEAAISLRDGYGTDHPELVGFVSWSQVEEYVQEEDESGDLPKMVRLIEAHGMEALLGALRAASDERYAEVVISTAHKSKGREWDAVRIADFALDTEKVSDADLMLAYVAVTRAKKVLDIGTLAEFLSETEEEAPEATVQPEAIAPAPAPVVSGETFEEYGIMRIDTDGRSTVTASGRDRARVEATIASLADLPGVTYRLAVRTVTATPWQ